MALSDSDKQRILEMLDEMDDRRAQTVLENKRSFAQWLKSAAWWLWERIKNNVDVIFSWLLRALWA